MKKIKSTITEIARETAELAHNFLMAQRDNEPLDGDETEDFSKKFLEELNKLNGNK